MLDKRIIEAEFCEDESTRIYLEGSNQIHLYDDAIGNYESYTIDIGGDTLIV